MVLPLITKAHESVAKADRQAMVENRWLSGKEYGLCSPNQLIALLGANIEGCARIIPERACGKAFFITAIKEHA